MQKVVLPVVMGLLIVFIFNGCSNPDPIGYKGGTYYGTHSKLAHMLVNRSIASESHNAWSSGNHTAGPVATGAVGPKKYTSQLNGLIENTDIGKVTHQAIKDGMNVIVVIGDGMGVSHMSLPIYMRIAEKKNEKTYFEKILDEGSCGITLTNPVGGVVTGSATSGTSIATGVKTYLGMVSVDTSGYPLKTSIELAKENNYSTGIISDAGITDATPAVFYAHSYNRDMENEIAAQLINPKIDVIFGGGASRFIPKNSNLQDFDCFSNSEQMQNAKSDREDDKNLIEEFVKNGYKVISNKVDLESLESNTDRVLGLFAPGGITAAIDRDTEKTLEPSIPAMSKKMFEILNSKKKNYFAMIEEARIDWEAHDNDMGAVYKAVEEMNNVLKICYEQYQNDEEHTLLIFTADHETGGLSITYTKRSEENMFKKKLDSGDIWTEKTDPLLFKEFLKLKNQKRTIYSDLENANSAEELYNLLNDNLDYEISRDDAEIIFQTRENYKKAK